MFQRVVDALFPPQCAACREAGSGLCRRCVPLDSTMSRRLKTLEVRAIGRYSGALRFAVLALKDGRRDVAAELGKRLGTFAEPSAILVPVPTTAGRRRVRGMDGVDIMARAAADAADAELCSALTRLHGGPQHGRSGEERRRARGRHFCSSVVSGRTVVLIDDVTTTGTTLEDCADAIRFAGGEVQEAIVVASADDDGVHDTRRSSLSRTHV
jgi:competence protein ComFC